MKKPNRSYRDRRLYFIHGFESHNHYRSYYDNGAKVKWVTDDTRTKFFKHKTNGEGADYLKEYAAGVDGCRYVYDMLVDAHGLEFSTEDALMWFKLQYE